MVIVARTDATTMDEGIARAQRFAEAGADVTLVDGLASVEALERVGEEVPGHKVINLIHGGKTPLLPSQELHALGFKVVLYSTPALYTAARTMMDLMVQLAETKNLGAISHESMTFRDFQAFMENRYFRRENAAGLGRVAANAQPVSHMRLQAARFDSEERRTGSGR